MGSGAGLVLSGLLLMPGCGEGAEPVLEHTSPLPVPVFEVSRTALDCADRVRQAFDAPAMPGVPALNAARLRLLAAVHHLFREPRLWIQRGDRTLFALRSANGRYV